VTDNLAVEQTWRGPPQRPQTPCRAAEPATSACWASTRGTAPVGVWASSNTRVHSVEDRLCIGENLVELG
jgi:hypothetical protein